MVDRGGLAYKPAKERRRRRGRSGEPPDGVRTTPSDGFKNRCDRFFWTGGRVVDCNGLENRHRGNPIGGSNPSPSANFR